MKLSIDWIEIELDHCFTLDLNWKWLLLVFKLDWNRF